MAHSWILTGWKRALLGAVDLLGRPLARALPRRAAHGRNIAPRRILVVELWQLGDVVMVTPFLRALRGCFPAADITLLAKPHARELLEGSGLVDEVLVAELPWTRARRKYHPADYDWRVLGELVRTLRGRRFDVAFDARMDIRNNVLLALTRATHRVGFRYGGGDWLLTHAVPVGSNDEHRVDDWLRLLPAAGCDRPVDRRPLLKTTREEQVAARELLARHFGDGPEPIVALHPGGSYPGKRWPLDRFLALASELAGDGVRVVAFEEASGYGLELREIPSVVLLRLRLRELMAVLEQCALLVCNDSGPMHIAAALGVRTVAIFERGEPMWFGPVGEGHVVIAGERAGVDRWAEPTSPPPANPVPLATVKGAVLKQIRSASLHRTFSEGMV